MQTANEDGSGGTETTRDEVVSYLDEIVMKLREHGLAFLGPYCAIIGRSLERKQQGGPWVVADTYDADQDERCRELLYCSLILLLLCIHQ